MDKYLLQLLKEKGSIIIPNIGALMRSSDSSPIIFNPHLKFNNGALENYICISEGISEQEAANMVSKYARNIQATVDKGDEYLMFDLGSFTKDDSGTIVFVEVSKDDTQSTSKPVSEIEEEVAPKADTKVEEKSKPKEEKPEEPQLKKEEKTPTENEAQKIEPEEKKVAPPVQPKADKKEEKTTEVKSSDTKPAAKKESTSKEDKKKTAQKVEEVAKTTNAAPKKENSEKKKKKNPVPLIILIIILGGGGAFVGLKFDMVKSWFVSAPIEPIKVMVEETGESTDTTGSLAMVDSTNTEGEKDLNQVEADEEEIVEKTSAAPVASKSISSNANYTIVLNVFADANNAKKYFGTISNNKQVSTNLRGSKTWIFYGSYNTRREANKDLQKAKNINPDAWIKKL